jgi:hypothetical protein
MRRLDRWQRGYAAKGVVVRCISEWDPSEAAKAWLEIAID